MQRKPKSLITRLDSYPHWVMAVSVSVYLWNEVAMNISFMSQKILWSGKGFVTFLAGKWSLTCMFSNMNCQVCWLGKGGATLSAKERTVTSVHSHVNSERAFLREVLTTHAALILLQTLVHQLVPFVRVSSCKCFFTFLTSKWPAVCVSPSVYSESTWGSEWSQAFRALVRFLSCVSANVCTQVAGIWEWLATVLADEWPLTSMFAHMVLEVTRPVKRSPALFALMVSLHRMQPSVYSEGVGLSEHLVTVRTVVDFVASVHAHVAKHVLKTWEKLTTVHAAKVLQRPILPVNLLMLQKFAAIRKHLAAEHAGIQALKLMLGLQVLHALCRSLKGYPTHSTNIHVCTSFIQAVVGFRFWAITSLKNKQTRLNGRKYRIQINLQILLATLILTKT